MLDDDLSALLYHKLTPRKEHRVDQTQMPQYNISHVWRHAGHRDAGATCVPAPRCRPSRTPRPGTVRLLSLSAEPCDRLPPASDAPAASLLLLLLAQPALDDELELEHGALRNVNRRGPRRVLLLVLHLRSGGGVPGASSGMSPHTTTPSPKAVLTLIPKRTGTVGCVGAGSRWSGSLSWSPSTASSACFCLCFGVTLDLDGEITVSIVHDVPDVDIVELLEQGVLLALGERSLGVLLRERRFHLSFVSWTRATRSRSREPSEDGGALDAV